ncbi:NAD-dependent succinate-semialdehyde dehydrogenase [Marinospirillum insulare]|uniref:NAD-dependent succinate-semialdehyde dehydrogenase n=1 Tax=Marinospirillum insulare TaxID=217169 RepID=A0ABQ5ZYE5_9GAMM|nr:NAD-dependent succinate-semialdehyde dehydrogenase [Marinospirillum insulare]GLR64050.1 NAD-dependent succinate-semialdehyde dehydrogenase [Marinospirillum insulare]
MPDTIQEFITNKAYINGLWINSLSNKRYKILNPATGEFLAEVPSMSDADTEQAINAANAALPAWKQLTAKERSQLLRRWFDLIMQNQDALATLMTQEQGKPLAEAKGEIAYAASFVEWFAEEAKRIDGEVLPGHQPDKRILVLKQPVGVVAAITPWNFPSAMITRKAAPALAAGCTLVLKPAPQTPLSALALAKLAEQAGIPAGVFNVVTADTDDARLVGEVLTASPIIRKLSFTGSTPVGIHLMQASAPTLKKLSLELGGNAPFIVFDDADLDAAVEGAIISKYRNAGQTCVCANRIYVQAGVYDAFAEKFSAAVQKLKVGSGIESGVEIGPLIDQKAVEKVEAHLKDALDKGGKLLLGGKRHSLGASFFEPTVITGANQDMRVAREETFGPLAPLFSFKDEAEVIQLANATEYGLAAYFYARDLSRVWKVAEELEYGMVGINTGVISTEVAPFGGIKSSGLGREGSRHGIDEYLEMKYLCLSV